MKTLETKTTNIRRQIVVCMNAFTLLSLVLAFPARSWAADASSADAIHHLEQIAAKPVIEESCLDLALDAGRVVDPDLDAASVKKQIAAMADEVRAEAAGKETPAEKVAALNKVIYEAHGFSVPPSDAPIISGKNALDLYMLHRFLASRKAHCEGQATLYAVVGEAAGLPVAVCNAPIHSYCQFGTGDAHLNVECTSSGSIRPDARVYRMNGAKPAALGSGVYFSPLTKKQFLCLQINSVAYGLAKQENGPAPLTLKQLVQLADLIQKLDPDRPESLDTVALIYSQAGDYQRAAKIEQHVLECAQRLGTTGSLMNYYRTTLNEYKQKAGEPSENKP
jgi:hypothetical protein